MGKLKSVTAMMVGGTRLCACLFYPCVWLCCMRLCPCCLLMVLVLVVLGEQDAGMGPREITAAILEGMMPADPEPLVAFTPTCVL